MANAYAHTYSPHTQTDTHIYIHIYTPYTHKAKVAAKVLKQVEDKKCKPLTREELQRAKKNSKQKLEKSIAYLQELKRKASLEKV